MNAEYARRMKMVISTSSPVDLDRSDRYLGGVLSNYGASGTVEFNLPTNAQKDDVFHAQVDVAQTLTLDPGTAGQVIAGTVTGTAGQKLSSSTKGDSTTLVCIAAGPIWRARNTVGTWSLA